MALCHPFLFLLFLTFSWKSYAQFDFESQKVKETYIEVLNLKVNTAKQSIAELKDTSQYQKNGIVPLLENYLDIITLLTVENKELYKTLKPNENKRIGQIKSLDKTSPYYYYALADIKLQWAFVELIYQDYVNGFLDLRRANELIEKNIDLHPNFQINNKVKGLIDLLTEAAPPEANLALLAAGLRRNTNGRQKLIRTAVFVPLLKDEINIYLTFVDAYVKNQNQKALWKIEKTYKNNPDNLFAQFTYLNILSKLDQHEKILEVLDTNNLSGNANYLYIPYIDYIKAESKMYALEFDHSLMCFNLFLSKAKTPAFQQIACFNIALIYSSLGRPDSAKYFLSKVKTLPSSDLYLDRYALFESENKFNFSKQLSLSRILYDGKHQSQCLEILSSLPPFQDKQLESERLYRMARSHWHLGNETEALKLFKQAVETPSYLDKTYFAAYSGYYAGYILLNQKKNEEARNYLLEAKKFKKHYYSDHISKKVDSKLEEIEN